MRRRLLVFFRRPPFSSIHYLEGLRACMGLTAGEDHHDVNIIYVEDGVYYALRDTDRSDAASFLSELKSAKVNLHVLDSSLRVRGIPPQEISPEYRIISTEDLKKSLAECDVTISF